MTVLTFKKILNEGKIDLHLASNKVYVSKPFSLAIEVL